MKKYVISLIVLFVFFGVLGWKVMSVDPVKMPLEAATSTPTEVNTATSTTTTPIISEKDQAWTVFQNYLSFAKAKNIAGITSLSYQLSDDCKNSSKDPVAKKSCEDKMQSVYLIGSEFKKADFVNLWSDSKQIILSTNFFRADTDNAAGLIHSIIFFVKDGGKIKLLSFSPGKGAFMPKTASTTEAEISKNLNAKIIDADHDGLEDAAENCTDLENTACTKTDPTKRDTNNNGYWDSIEALFYK